MRWSCFAKFCALLGTVWLGLSSAAPVQAIELLPHQAVYRMSLADATPRSGVAGANGVMMYKFEETCDGWASETNVILKLQYREGDEVETIWSMVSWEAKDGLKYRFRVRHSRNGTPVEVLKGSVVRENDNGPAIAKFSSPQGKVINLPEGTMFPTHHLQALIKEGEKGALTFTRTVFDGASLDNPYSINALITGRPKSKQKKSGNDELAKTGERHIRMAFFPVASRKEFPEFELGIDYQANGIANNIVQDFGEFSLNLVAEKIENLSRPGC